MPLLRFCAEMAGVVWFTAYWGWSHMLVHKNGEYMGWCFGQWRRVARPASGVCFVFFDNIRGYFQLCCRILYVIWVQIMKNVVFTWRSSSVGYDTLEDLLWYLWGQKYLWIEVSSFWADLTLITQYWWLFFQCGKWHYDEMFCILVVHTFSDQYSYLNTQNQETRTKYQCANIINHR
jgi:hypothetical protein